MIALSSYIIGAVIGFVVTLAVMTGSITAATQAEMFAWLDVNLGHSVWMFTACFTCYLLSLSSLSDKLRGKEMDPASYESVVQMDQVSDVLIHVFIGIGVVWTAVGMRSALVSTLSVPDHLANDAGDVLSRLVDGGILLALSTTIVGAVGGYLMHLGKTIYLGAQLTAWYQAHDREDLQATLSKLDRISGQLARLADRESLHQGGFNGQS